MAFLTIIALFETKYSAAFFYIGLSFSKPKKAADVAKMKAEENMEQTMDQKHEQQRRVEVEELRRIQSLLQKQSPCLKRWTLIERRKWTSIAYPISMDGKSRQDGFLQLAVCMMTEFSLILSELGYSNIYMCSILYCRVM